jgi:hypothetical protein
MRRILMVGLGVLTAGAVGCGDESPTGVGADLMGPGVRTFEVTFEAADFLVRDTTFDRIGTLSDAEFDMAANQFDGELDARTLFSLLRPVTVTYVMDGTTRTDTVAAVVGGTLTLVVDTIATASGPIDLEVVEVTEAWDRPSATWTVRTDTAGVTETWETPGGSPGAVLAAGSWTAGDTLRIALDSAAAAVWDDTTAARLGGLIRTTTPGSRIFFHSMRFQYDVVPAGVDTVVAAGSIVASKIIVTPEVVPPPAGVLRVGGLPAWRALLRFQPLTDLLIPCGPGQPEGCTVRLADVTVNLASVLLHPVPAGSRRPERPVRLEARAVLEGPNIPLVRSPLTPPLGAPSDSLAPELFAASEPEPAPVRLPITGFLQHHLDPPVEEQRPPLWLSLTAVGERGQFGYTAFGSMASDRPPRLRLTVSVPDEVLVR